MNPVEDEAVLAEAISRCGGPKMVRIVETKDLLPGLKRESGLKQWNVMDKAGRTWKDYDAVLTQKAASGEEGLGRLSESMFPPKEDLPLDRAIRVFPHQQDTGAFFIAIPEKQSEIKAKPEEEPASAVAPAKLEAADSNGMNVKLETAPNGIVEAINGAATADSDTPSKRKRSDHEAEDDEGCAHEALRAKNIPKPRPQVNQMSEHRLQIRLWSQQTASS